MPNIYWDYTRENVLVMERIFGIQISDTEELNKNNINIKRLAEKGVEIFFTQVFQHNFFHADMHPGNIFVSYDNPDDPKYCAVDFGIMGSLSDSDQKYLALNFQAFFEEIIKKLLNFMLTLVGLVKIQELMSLRILLEVYVSQFLKNH